MHALTPLFAPRSVAIVGASADPNKIGGRPLAFLKQAGYAGAIYPVNPGADVVQGLRAHASLDAIGAPVEQVIVALPAAQVMGALEACVRLGVRAVQIFSSALAEGGAGRLHEQQLESVVGGSGLRVLGPNSLGLFNTAERFFGTFATALDGAWPSAGSVGVATQSGAFGSYFFGMAQARGLAFSHFVATGNEADVDIADCIDFLAADDGTRVIVTALEGCRDGRKLARALLAAAAAGKPVLAMKVGVSAEGALAAATHTGSLAAEDRVFDAVLRDCGASRAASLEGLVDAAYLATQAPRPTRRDLLIVTTSGGIGVLAADAASAAGLALPPIDDAALVAIRKVNALADGRNPVDTSAGIIGDLAQYARIGGAVLASRPFGAVLCYLAHIARNPQHWAQLREPLYQLRQRHATLPFVAVLMTGSDVRTDLEAHGFAVFEDPTRAVRALGALAPTGGLAPQIALGAADASMRVGVRLATEADAKAALGRVGIRFVPEAFVADEDAAARAAAALGYPVVLKIVSPDIAHKTEVGGVALGLVDEAQLRDAARTMTVCVAERAPRARRDGFLVARHLTGGVEVIVGAHVDPVFGSIVSVGAGGVLAELVDDVCLRLAPVTFGEATAMLAGTRVAKLLGGYRGSPGADIAALASQVAILSAVAAASTGTLRGLELNPVLAMPDGAYAVDALAQSLEGPTP